MFHIPEDLSPYQEARLSAVLSREGYMSTVANPYERGSWEFDEYQRGLYDDGQAQNHKVSYRSMVEVEA